MRIIKCRTVIFYSGAYQQHWYTSFKEEEKNILHEVE